MSIYVIMMLALIFDHVKDLSCTAFTSAAIDFKLLLWSSRPRQHSASAPKCSPHLTLSKLAVTRTHFAETSLLRST